MSTRAGGSAWRSYSSAQVLGAGGARLLLGMFAPSDVTTDEKDAPEILEAVEQEAKARKFRGLVWSNESIPPPDFIVVSDEIGPSCRADVSVYLKDDDDILQEVRFLGPRRNTVAEARKDGCELRRTAFVSIQQGSSLTQLWKRCLELASIRWTAEQLGGDDVEEATEKQLPEFKAVQPLKREHYADAREWFHSTEKNKSYEAKFLPVGPHWTTTQDATPVPKLPGTWYMHERQSQDGKHFPFLFFNSHSGKYYRNRSADAVYSAESSRWLQTGQPNLGDEDSAVKIVHGSACFPAASGRKDDMAVLLPELGRTGTLLKYPLPFADKPAALFLLVDGLRESNTAAEYCAKRFHTQILPRLSGCHSKIADHELVTMVKESLEKLDRALLESGARYSGCSLAVALVLGRRMLVCTLGGCRAALCTLSPDDGSKKSKTPGASCKTSLWSTRMLEGNVLGHTSEEIQAAERKRRLEAYAPLDFDGQPGEELAAASAREEVLASQGLSDRDRAIRRVLRAAHPFAVLGLPVAEAVAIGPTAGQKAVDSFQAAIGSANGEPLAEAALSRVVAAGATVDKMLAQDAFGTSQLGELFYAMDEEDGIMSSQRAAALLGVQPGCGEATARAAVEMRYQAIFAGIAAACPAEAAKGWEILGEVIDAAARPTAALWMPPTGSRAVSVGRAMGLRDLKQPRMLVGLETACEIIHFEPGSTCCLTLLTDTAADNITEQRISAIIEENKGRPKAACLQIASDAIGKVKDGTAVPSVGAVAVFFTVAAPEDPAVAAAIQEITDPKKRKLAEMTAIVASKPPARVRIAHILLKWEGLKDPDKQARRAAPKGRTQVDAEKELLKYLQVLNAVPRGTPDAAKKVTAKFAELAKQHSDCKSATNGSFADLGWILPKEIKGEVETVAFELPVGGISDVIVTPRGAHIVHRLA
eukprot:TRINITY_DN15958_c0_g1_i3.p1 TRINITY_DN15958_c0_g1~~TRINITY_DN15958_c0_g1_i3.p1  ORF type:complete len:931 (-),score=188.07 TRINITY_DN15958_c0_g1_i3:307-3099(-)